MNQPNPYEPSSAPLAAEIPARRCGNCGGPMLARSFTEYAYGGFIKTGRKYHYACSGCGAKASLYSPGRLVLLVTAIPVVAWVILLERYAVWWRALAGIGLAFTLYRLVVDVVTRMRHRPAA